jgi:ketose-bisphosphate aldolase
MKQPIAFSHMLQEARLGQYAVAAFNAYSLESFQAALRAADNAGVPVLIALGERYFSNLRPRVAFGMLQGLLAASEIGDAYPLRVGLHLDHALQFESCREAIEAGFSSVMIDASGEAFEENVSRTRQVVELAHARGVGVEAELGGLAAGAASHEFEQGDEVLTDPKQAEMFVRETGVDALAVSIGTVHGMYKGEPHLDFARLDEIARRVSVPLVLHGGSGTPPELLAKAIRLGIAKVNVNTEASLAAVDAIHSRLSQEQTPHLSELGILSRSAMEAVMQKYIRSFQPGR